MSVKTNEDDESEKSEQTSTYQISAVAAYSRIDVEAESADKAIDKAMDELKKALSDGKFELTEVESQEMTGSGWGIWEL